MKIFYTFMWKHMKKIHDTYACVNKFSTNLVRKTKKENEKKKTHKHMIYNCYLIKFKILKIKTMLIECQISKNKLI